MRRPVLDPDAKTPIYHLQIGDEVYVEGYAREGTRKIVALFDQKKVPGGVTIDRAIDGIFVSWNEDALVLIKRRTDGAEEHRTGTSP